MGFEILADVSMILVHKKEAGHGPPLPNDLLMMVYLIRRIKFLNVNVPALGHACLLGECG